MTSIFTSHCHHSTSAFVMSRQLLLKKYFHLSLFLTTLTLIHYMLSLLGTLDMATLLSYCFSETL